VIFATSSFQISGPVSEYLSKADSLHVMRRRFCPTRGTPLFSDDLGLPAFVVVRAGALDNPEIGRPASTIWTASTPSWAFIDPTLPACAGQVSATLVVE
jgi:hypothetical protein